MATTLLGTYYAERPGSPEESFANGVGSVKRTFDVVWTQRWRFCQEILGYSEVKDNNGDYIARKPPEAYPGVSNIINNQFDNALGFDRWLYPVSIDSIQGIGPIGKEDDVDVFKYEYARVSVTYQSLNYFVFSDEECETAGWTDSFGNPVDVYQDATGKTEIIRYVTRQIQPTAEHLQLPFGQMKWADGSATPAVSGIGKIIPTLEVLYTWHQVPSKYLNVSSQVEQLYDKIGTVNEYEFDHCPAGTLLLTAIETKPYRMLGGGTVSDITFKMKYFNAIEMDGLVSGKGHNYFLHFTVYQIPIPPHSTISAYRYDLLTTDGTTTGRKVYNTSDFADLFQAF